MITFIKKLIKKQTLLKKYKKGDKQFSELIWLLKNFKWSDEEKHFFMHEYNCEKRCYNRLKTL
jgi:hypothetical protein